MYTNSDYNQKLLQLFILLTDEKEITYESFNDYVSINPSSFSRLIKEYQQMIIKLNLKYTLTIVQVPNQKDEIYMPTKKYYQTAIVEDNSFKTDDLSEEEINRYIYVIIYLMLKSGHYISYIKIKNRLGINITDTTFKTIIDNIKQIVGFDIFKNEFQSFVMDYDS